MDYYIIMEINVFDILRIVGALGFFIYGMKVMSEGIQKAAGDKMRQILNTITANRFMGVVTGFLLTSIVQSSSATTVMVVSFVNAGLLSLVEAIGVVMGANIGTTITAWLITIFGFKVKIVSVALPIIGIGFPMLFSSNNKVKLWAEVFIGFALLFMGLDALKASMPNLTESQLSFLNGYTDLGRLSVVLFVCIGTIVTILVQSSSAAMALTLVLCHKGVIPFEMAAAMVLGENIGTTITANLAALVANTHAKRAARAHFLFNIIGVTWMFIMFPFFISFIKSYVPLFINIVNDYVFSVQSTSDSGSQGYTAVLFSLSIFHTFFNITNTVLLIWFVPHITKLSIKMVPANKGADEEFQLEFIGNTFFGKLSEVSMLEAKKEIYKFGKITKTMSDNTQKAINETEKKNRKKTLSKIKEYEILTDKLEIAIADFLTKASQNNITHKSSRDIRIMLSIINDLERIGDLFQSIAVTITKKYDQKLWFSNLQKDKLNTMFDKLNRALSIMLKNLDLSYSQVNKMEATQAEQDINLLASELRKDYLSQVQQGTDNLTTIMAYYDIFSTCERIGDHIINVTEGITGDI